MAKNTPVKKGQVVLSAPPLAVAAPMKRAAGAAGIVGLEPLKKGASKAKGSKKPKATKHY